MKLIQKLSDMIEEEIEGATEYGKCAVKYKEENPILAKTFYDIATQELQHIGMLHEQVVKIIEEYRKTNGEPPASMQAVYDYLHNRQIEKANKAKSYLATYRGVQ